MSHWSRPRVELSGLARCAASVVVVSATACLGSADPPSTTEFRPDLVPGTTATTSLPAHSDTDGNVAYVEAALEFMEDTYYLGEDTNWGTLRELSLAAVKDEPSREGAYEAIQFATGALDTTHTFFVPPEADEPVSVSAREPPSGKRLDGSIGYLSLTGIEGGSEETPEYAESVRQIMKAVDGEDPVCGWVLDLRESIGGSSIGDWLALGPLVGDPLLMRAGRSAGGPTSIYYEEGRIRYEGESISGGEEVRPESLPPDAYIPERLDVPVAVLISSRTASAGEAIAVTFAGRPHTRFFGEQTFGATTSHESLEFPDGGLLRVASGLYQDRTGQSYEGGVMPDTQVAMIENGVEDAVLEASSTWLSDMDDCEQSAG
jgi:carboxyl-terminal processing protease